MKVNVDDRSPDRLDGSSSRESQEDIEDRIDHWLQYHGIRPASPSLKQREFNESCRRSTCRSLASIASPVTGSYS